MRRSEAARYARWAATVALVLTAAVAGVYGWRYVQAQRVRRAAPPPVPVEVKERLTEFSFSKVEGGRTLFQVRASRTTEYKEGRKALLEDVWITIYGRSGKRFDNIHTRQCDYLPAEGRVICAGDVEFDLQSAEEARLRPGERTLHVSTSRVVFDRESGVAHTDQPVIFRFPYGQGKAVGATYRTREAVFILHREIQLTLSARHPNQPAAEPLQVTGSALEYDRETQTMRLLAPVRVQQGSRTVASGHLTVWFDGNLRARKLETSAPTRLESVEPQGKFELTAEQILATFDEKGWTERWTARGNVQARLAASTGEQRLRCGQLELEMVPGRNEPQTLLASGGVEALAEAHGEQRRLATDAARFGLTKAAGGRGYRVERGETLAEGRIELRTRGELTTIRAERFAAEFDERSAIRHLRGGEGTRMERRRQGGAVEDIMARELALNFSPEGEWSEAELSGNVRYRAGERRATAETAQLERGKELLTLRGGVTVADELTTTTAPVFTLDTARGDIRGEGGVRTTYLRAEPGGVANLSGQPAHLSAQTLTANTKTGRALYSGRARLWQGEAVIEASSIELLREEKRLEARGGVNALLPPRPEAGTPRAATPQGMWRLRAERMTYFSTEGRALLQGDVSAESTSGKIGAREIEIYLEGRSGGQRELARAVARGGVTVRQGARRGTAEQGEYAAAEGKFVLSGGNPTLTDPSLGTSTGRKLTFFLADDRILIDSEEGSRTISRHRVEK